MVAPQVGRYALQRALGTGAAGTVHLAIDDESGRQVAIKLLNAKTVGNPDIQKRFVREVSVLEKLHHPNVVEHYDCGIDEQGRLYFVMEYVDSGTLFDALRTRRRIPWQESLGIAAQICDALAHTHERGVIHRDLKPANLFLSSEGDIKVGDFGLARDQNLHRLTAQGSTVGTCRYMAPEQVRGEDELSGSVDIYAVGCILFEMISGRPPFNGASVIEVFEHHLFTPVPRLSRAVDQCPRKVSEYIAQLMAKTIEERPASAATVANTLRVLASERDIKVTKLPGVYHAGDTLVGDTLDSGSNKRDVELAEPSIQLKGKWSPQTIGLISLVVAILAVLAIFAFLNR